jgi:hypothetical protein
MSSTDAETNDLENARVEYVAAQDAYLHYDNYSWQVGSVLVAGAFVFWGFLLDKITNSQSPPLLGCANLVVCLLMSAWLLYANHNREIYLLKLHRVRQLESLLKMWQHRRFASFSNKKAQYSVHWPSGHVLNYFIYVLVSLGGPALVLVPNLSKCWAWSSIGINAVVVVLVLVRAVKVNCEIDSMIRKMEKEVASGTQGG